MLKKNLLSAEAAVSAASAAAIAEIALTQVKTVRTRSIIHPLRSSRRKNAQNACVATDGIVAMRCERQQLDLGPLRLWSNMSVRALKNYGRSLVRSEWLGC